MDERIAGESFATNARRHMVAAYAHRAKSANVVHSARIFALVVHARLVGRAIRIQHTFRSTAAFRIAFEILDARA